MTASSAQRIIREEHAALAAMLLSIRALVDSGSGDDRRDFFETVAAMLFYVDEFPERRHHPTESNLLFPMLLKAAPELHAVIRRLEMDHVAGEGRVRELQHLLHAWQFLGEPRRPAFVAALAEYVRFYLHHMQIEERELLPIAAQKLTPEQSAQLDAAFEAMRDPLAGGKAEPLYEALFRRITEHARNPIGLGAS
jgi:hemerythrin-like domain-containing protein